jgi:hypothetical protein
MSVPIRSKLCWHFVLDFIVTEQTSRELADRVREQRVIVVVRQSRVCTLLIRRHSDAHRSLSKRCETVRLNRLVESYWRQ